MQYRVPQFIDIEDKIFWSLTFKQFIYIAGALGVFVVSLIYMPKVLAIILAGPFAALGVALAFYKVNNRPFSKLLESMFYFAIKPRLYLWQLRKKSKKITRNKTNQETNNSEVKMTPGKLRELAWNLDINESIYLQRAKHL